MSDFLRGPQPAEQQRPLLNPREQTVTDRNTTEWLNRRTTLLEPADLPPLEPIRTQPQLTVEHLDRRIPQWIHLPEMEHVQGIETEYHPEYFPVPPLLRTEIYQMEPSHERILIDATSVR